MKSYQGLRENEQRGSSIVNSIIATARQCNLDKDALERKRCLPIASKHEFYMSIFYMYTSVLNPVSNEKTLFVNGIEGDTMNICTG